MGSAVMASTTGLQRQRVRLSHQLSGMANMNKMSVVIAANLNESTNGVMSKPATSITAPPK
jgi:hypothetical protein